MPMLKAVVFDVDGTLVDSNDLHVEAWREVFRRHGKEVPAAAVREQIGKGGDQLLPVFWSEDDLQRFGDQMEKERVALFTEKYLPHARPFPKVRELFERIRANGLEIALASSAKEAELDHHKQTLGIEPLLQAATSSDDAERSKPYPDIFQAALAQLRGVRSAEAVVVGDTPYDVQAARKAGMRTIALLSGGFPEDVLRDAGAAEIYRDCADLLHRYDESLLARERAQR